MTVTHLLCVALGLAAVVVTIHGLELSIEMKSGSTCGVVTCEDVDIPANHRITELGIYRTGERPIKLSLNKPKISGDVDGVQVEGNLESSRAKLTINEKNCLVEFSCKVKTVDNKGNKMVQTNTLKQPHKAGGGGDEASPENLPQQVAGLSDSVGDLLKTQKEIESRVIEKLSQLETAECTSGGNEDAISEILDDFKSSLQEQTEEMMSWKEKNEERFNTLLQTKPESESGEELCRNLQSDFSEEYKNLYKDFEELEEDMSKSTTSTLSAVNDLMKDLSAGSSTSVTSENGGLSTSIKGNVASCKKGMKYVASCLPPRLVVYPDESSEVDVPLLCDTETGDGGWIVIQRRYIWKIDFYRGWDEYKKGFGDLVGNDDFWWGLDNIHKITRDGTWELRVDMRDRNEVHKYARYTTFSIDGEENDYKLNLGTYYGTAGDSLSQHKNHKFSTKDRDNDIDPNNVRAVLYQGGWWYYNNWFSNLNGNYASTGNVQATMWRTFTGAYSVTFSEMKIRRAKVA